MTRARVTHIITRLIVGGAQENTVLTCAHLDRSRYDVSLICGPQTGPEGELHSEARRLGIDPIVEPSLVREINPVQDLLSVARLTAHLQRIKPEVVHTHSSKAGVVGRIAARAAGVPVIIHTVHGWGFHDRTPPPARICYVRLERWLAAHTDALVVVADRDREKGLDERIGTLAQYRTIRSGVNVAAFRQRPVDPWRLRRELGIPESARIVGTVGRLSRQKNPLGFVEAATYVRGSGLDVHFVMVGDGPLRDDVLELAKANGLEGRLHLTGIRRDVAAILHSFDVFVLSSLWEGLPRVVPQAMAAGVPVVAWGADGIAEIISSGVNGYCVDVGDTEQLGVRIVEVLKNADLAGRLVEAAGNTVLEYDVSLMVEQLDALYCELMSRR
jgi:glycosyltransferase involved in cell wall biosynthesis